MPGPVEPLFRAPGHPYTRALRASTPVPDPGRRAIIHGAPVRGEIPSPLDPPPGGRFHTRCPLAREVCRVTPPPMVDFPDGVSAACHFADDVRQAEVAAR